MLTRPLLATVALVTIATSCATAAEVRYYQENGTTYRETRWAVQRPVTETQWQQSTQTVYREQLTTETRDTLRSSWTPVTEYQWEAYWVGRWNPFVDPYLAYRMVPRTRWEQRTETVALPVTSRRLVPETRTVQVPVTTSRVVTEELVSRVAVAPAAPDSAVALAPMPRPMPAQGASIGGVARLDRDPPRQGVSTVWRPATGSR